MLDSLNVLFTNVSRRFVHITANQCKGHAKWQNIKHVKAENDRQKMQMNARQIRLIRIAAIEGGSPNPELNSALRNAIEEANRRYVPKSTIQGCLKRMTENKDKTIYQRYLFEGRLYKKLSFIVTIFTDNLAHARIQMATAYRKHLAETTNTKRLFTERGVFNVIARDGIDINNIEDECLNDAIECGAEDIDVFDAAERKVTFLCDAKEFLKVKHKLSAIGHQIEHSELEFFPNTNLARLTDAELVDYKKFKLKLADVEGFDEIYDNLENDDDDDDDVS